MTRALPGALASGHASALQGSPRVVIVGAGFGGISCSARALMTPLCSSC
ncbi:MAG: hypothetical protein ACLP2F_09025 [Steroidobacteraceae bacterium]